MKNPAIFFGAIGVAIIAALICVYYAIPGINHVLVSTDPTGFHLKHVVAFAAIAILCIIAALVTRPKKSVA